MVHAASPAPLAAVAATPVESDPAVEPGTERAPTPPAATPPAAARHAEPALEAPVIPDAAQPGDAGGGGPREVAHPPRRSTPLPGLASPTPPIAGERRPKTSEPEDQGDRGATGPQLRRFIKSRAYVPMHELRRRFAINGQDDDVTAVDLEKRRVFVGLPDREGHLLGELLRGGDIGYELSMDPITPIVVGVYPMRPVTRP